MQNLGEYYSDSEEEYETAQNSASIQPLAPTHFTSESITMPVETSPKKENETEIAISTEAEEVIVEEQIVSPPPKRKFEPFIPEFIDETRELSTTEKVHRIMQNQGCLSKGLPPSINLETEDPLQEKIKLWTNVREQGLHFNERLLNTHAFCNPLIMTKMIAYMKLDQYGSNLDEELFNPNELLSLPSYEELSNHH
jgi:hypothetical protein